MFCLQHYAWLNSCDQDGSFGTKISGSLIVRPVLWVLSSRNTLSVTHSYTASYLLSLENSWNSAPMCSFSPIQGTMSWLVLEFHVARIWECNLCTGSSKIVHGEVFMWPINSSCFFMLLRQIMQVSNLSHDVSSNVLLNFVICFKGLLAVREAQLQHLRFWVCSYTNFHVLNNLHLLDEVGMAEWARIVISFRRSLHLLGYFLLNGWPKARKD